MDTPSDTGYDGKDTRDGHARRRPVQPPDQPRGRPEGRPLRLRRLRQLPRAPVLADGELKRSWGAPGTGPGQFILPHGIAVARRRARLRVRPRERPHPDLQPGRRVPLASGPTPQRPTHLVFDAQGRAYVSELWWQPGQTSQRATARIGDTRSGRVASTTRTAACSRAGAAPDPPRGELRGAARPGGGLAPRPLRGRGHVDVRGAAAATCPRSCHTFQKFALKS